MSFKLSLKKSHEDCEEFSPEEKAKMNRTCIRFANRRCNGQPNFAQYTAYTPFNNPIAGVVLEIDQETGKPTPRGQSIIDHTPAGRYGSPQDLLGGLIWLVSPGAAFVNGIVLPIDGGFSAFSGV